MKFRLLDSFADLFAGRAYLHRNSSLGDRVAMQLYEDLYALGRSEMFKSRVEADIAILNVANKRQGVTARRGDGSFGEIVPGAPAKRDPGYDVARGPIATIEVGVEVKILMKAMIKQIDRVTNDLKKQSDQFRLKRGNPICVAVVGINHAAFTTSYEGERSFRTDGTKHKHPSTEAVEAEARLAANAASAYDEFLFLRFRAKNEPPFAFEWVDEASTRLDYAAALARVSQAYRR